MKKKSVRMMEGEIFDMTGENHNLEHVGTVEYDLQYAARSENNKLDIYFPAERREKYPVAVFIHGGAFFKSSRKRHLSNILECLSFGCAVASIDYRFNHETTYPGIRQDCIDAFNYLAERNDIDEKKMVLWGESHGALITDDIVISCAERLKFRPSGVVSFYAPIDMKNFYLYKEEHGEHVYVDGHENDSAIYGATGEALLTEMEKYAVLRNVTGKEPPFFLLHGMQDATIPCKYTEEFDAVLTEKKVEHITWLAEEGIHGIDFYAEPKYNTQVMEFIKRVVERV